MKLTLLGTGCPSVDFKRCGSSNLISTKSTLALQYNPQLADATKVIEEVQSQSPSSSPRAKHAICKALVALFTAITLLALTFVAIFFSL